MTLIDAIKKGLKAAGIDEKYAQKVQKLFNIEKEDGLETYIQLFKDNILPDLQPSGQATQETIQASVNAAIAEYEKKYGLKEGKPIESPNPDEDKFKGLDPSVKALIEAQNKQLEEMKALIEGNQKKAATAEMSVKAKKLMEDAKLPENWLGRVDLESKTPIEDQVKILSDEYIKIQQDAINQKVANGEYHVGGFQPKDRSEADWAKLMDGDTNPNNPGTVDLGLK